MKVKGSRALVTGASSGIGEQLARQLAARGADLVLVARRADRLERLAEQLRAAHGVEVRCVPLDLGAADAVGRLWQETEGSKLAIDIVVNNAGFGIHAPFVQAPWARTEAMLQLNIMALTELSRRFAAAMRQRGAGYLLNVSSIGAYLPVPLFAAYAASKAYVRSFTEALAFELAGSGVRVCCLCPGGTATEFMAVSGQQPPPLEALTMMSAARCARIGLRALLAGRRCIVSGRLNALGMFLLRFVPRRVATWLAARVLG